MELMDKDMLLMDKDTELEIRIVQLESDLSELEFWHDLNCLDIDDALFLIFDLYVQLELEPPFDPFGIDCFTGAPSQP